MLFENMKTRAHTLSSVEFRIVWWPPVRKFWWVLEGSWG